MEDHSVHCTLSHDIFILGGTDDIQVFLDDIIVSVVNAGREGGSDKTRVAKEEGKRGGGGGWERDTS